ncbi:hypothetical protein HWV62_16058 [Athelia sp. TMB]|nr:hypothetical protein HWV62_16058 [Athelia sp. TMB]
MFSSEKVLQMSYANYQGKEALVEKFKNSCIMDEREAWRPKIFHSEPGPEQGLPEPFPAPTHLRRKERGTYNRGALFVPGIGGRGEGGREHQHHLHNTSRALRAVDVESSEPEVLADEQPANSSSRSAYRPKKGSHPLLNRPL